MATRTAITSTTSSTSSTSSTGFRDLAARATDDDSPRLSAREAERRYETHRVRGSLTVLVVLVGIPATVILAVVGFSAVVENFALGLGH